MVQEKNEKISAQHLDNPTTQKSEALEENTELLNIPLVNENDNGNGAQKDGREDKLKKTREDAQKIENNKNGVENPNDDPVDIKSLEDLSAIKNHQEKLKALLRLAEKGEKEKEKALEIAKGSWEHNRDPLILDKTRDKISEETKK